MTGDERRNQTREADEAREAEEQVEDLSPSAADAEHVKGGEPKNEIIIEGGGAPTNRF